MKSCEYIRLVLCCFPRRSRTECCTKIPKILINRILSILHLTLLWSVEARDILFAKSSPAFFDNCLGNLLVLRENYFVFKNSPVLLDLLFIIKSKMFGNRLYNTKSFTKTNSFLFNFFVVILKYLPECLQYCRMYSNNLNFFGLDKGCETFCTCEAIFFAIYWLNFSLIRGLFYFYFIFYLLFDYWIDTIIFTLILWV